MYYMPGGHRIPLMVELYCCMYIGHTNRAHTMSVYIYNIICAYEHTQGQYTAIQNTKYKNTPNNRHTQVV